MEIAAPPLLQRLREAIRARHYSIRTEEAYAFWVRRYILFHDKRHPVEMGEAEVRKSLTNLATQGEVAASTQNQALNALIFLYRHVLERPLATWERSYVRNARSDCLSCSPSRKWVGYCRACRASIG